MNQRTALGDMLQQLLKQKDQREQELRQVLVRNRSVVWRSSRSQLAASTVWDSVCDGHQILQSLLDTALEAVAVQ